VSVEWTGDFTRGKEVLASTTPTTNDDGTTSDPVAELEEPMGLTSSQEGYRVVADRTELEPGVEAPFRFRITGPDGAVVRDYRQEHERDLHLIVVSRDLARFQHVHPSRASDGTWQVPLTLPVAGPYRAYADFVPAGRDDGLTLGLDLTATGDHQPQQLPAAATTAEVDGYQLELDGRLTAEREADLTFRIQRGEAAVTDLDPYLGAYGHLVAIRASDLAYLHVHPTGEPGDGRTVGGPDVRFAVHVPSAGDYRLFLDFSHGGEVHTAAFTARVAEAAPTTDASEPSSGEEHDGH
jgi:hypothetical protein